MSPRLRTLLLSESTTGLCARVREAVKPPKMFPPERLLDAYRGLTDTCIITFFDPSSAFTHGFVGGVFI